MRITTVTTVLVQNLPSRPAARGAASRKAEANQTSVFATAYWPLLICVLRRATNQPARGGSVFPPCGPGDRVLPSKTMHSQAQTLDGIGHLGSSFDAEQATAAAGKQKGVLKRLLTKCKWSCPSSLGCRCPTQNPACRQALSANPCLMGAWVMGVSLSGCCALWGTAYEAATPLACQHTVRAVCLLLEPQT
jgi:hypothetical protein